MITRRQAIKTILAGIAMVSVPASLLFKPKPIGRCEAFRFIESPKSKSKHEPSFSVRGLDYIQYASTKCGKFTYVKYPGENNYDKFALSTPFDITTGVYVGTYPVKRYHDPHPELWLPSKQRELIRKYGTTNNA